MRAPREITLRPWREDDAPHLAEILNDPQVLASLAAAMPYPYTREHAADFIALVQQPGMMQFAICADGEAVGNIGAVDCGTEIELGYYIGRAHWNRGIATRALALFLQKLRPLGKPISAHVFAFNPASAKVLYNNGFNRRSGYQMEPSFQGPNAPIFIYDLPQIAGA